jgi:hypothetical protein
MSDSTTIRPAPSTNGRVYLQEPADADTASDAAPTRSRGISSMIVPVVLIVTALIVLRRMQRGNYA